MNTVTNSEGFTFTYDTLREAMKGEPWTMNLASKGEILAVVEVVNQGIDSHLEACNCPERGDSYTFGHRMDCVVSVESFPTLVRRLYELGTEEAMNLADDMLTVLFRKD